MASWRLGGISVFVLVLTACGYSPVHTGVGDAHLHVVLAESKVPDAVASDEVLAGVREELARSGSLAAGGGFPRCEVEILRIDEASEGIAATPGSSGDLVPEARATRVGLVARAWVLRAPGGDRERDTGDVRAFETVAIAPDARSATFRHSDALRAAGRRVGRRLASRILGLPSANDE
ncbi:MAG: hypothetical protein JWM74_5733 [Myxococcaceae bacterium]|jgi:hypothetical protein|nr:hypothetical protein [Myxococcaceae bacterium]